MKKKITVVVVTYQTNKNILLKCLKSIDKDIKIIDFIRYKVGEGV